MALANPISHSGDFVIASGKAVDTAKITLYFALDFATSHLTLTDDADGSRTGCFAGCLRLFHLLCFREILAPWRRLDDNQFNCVDHDSCFAQLTYGSFLRALMLACLYYTG